MIFSLPLNTQLGHLEIVDVYQYYDFPRIFLCKNRTNVQFLVLSTYDDFDEFEWLYLPVSNDRIISILSQRITLRHAFSSPEDEFLYTVSSNFDGKSTVYSVLAEEVPDEDLPKDNVYLECDGLEVSMGFGAVDAQEAARASRRETYNLHLYPADSRTPELELKGFGVLLTTFQSLADALGQYCKGKPTASGAIPSEVLSETRFKATQIFDGSFGIQFKSDITSDLFNGSLASDVLQELTGLLSVSSDDVEVTKKLHQLEARVASKYKSFLKSLMYLDSPLKVEWGSPCEGRGGALRLDKKSISSALELVSKIEKDMSEPIKFKAELLGLDIKTKAFRVIDLANGESYSGKVSDEYVAEISLKKIKGVYHVALKRIVETNLSSGFEHEKWILTSLEEVE